jgi:hypothetical protein
MEDIIARSTVRVVEFALLDLWLRFAPRQAIKVANRIAAI